MREKRRNLAVRLEMTKAAAPYLHPRLQAIEHSGKEEEAISKNLVIHFVDSNGHSTLGLDRNMRRTMITDSPDLLDNPNGQRLLPDYQAKGGGL